MKRSIRTDNNRAVSRYGFVVIVVVDSRGVVKLSIRDDDSRPVSRYVAVGCMFLWVPTVFFLCFLCVLSLPGSHGVR